MVFPHRIHEIQLVFAITLFSSVMGCVNLDKRNPAPFRFGQKTNADQTVATKAGMRKSAKKMERNIKPSGFAKKAKQLWPFRSKVQMTVQEPPLASNDPTRLNNMPENVGADLNIATAKLAEKAGDYKAAMKQYQTALSKDSQSRNALIGLARLHHRAGNTEGAIRVYQDALGHYRNDAVIMNDLGICYARSKQLNESIAMLEAATQAAPKREMYLNNLAAALVDANRTEEAFTRLAQRRGPAVANYNIGYLMTKSGRNNEAHPYLQKALELKPDLQEARTLLAQQPALQVSSRPSSPSMGNSNYQPPGEFKNPPEFYNGQPSAGADAPAEFVNPPATNDSQMPWQNDLQSGPYGMAPVGVQKIQVVSYVEDVTS